MYQGLGLSVGSTDAHAIGALSATQPVMRGGQDQVDQGRSERGVLCTRVTEDAEMRRSSLSRLVLMGETGSTPDPIGSVINPAGNTTGEYTPGEWSSTPAVEVTPATLTSGSIETVRRFPSTPDGIERTAPGFARGAVADVLMANTCSAPDPNRAGNNSCFNSVAPGDARGAKARAAGPMSRECAYGNDDLFSTGDTKGSSDMRESMRNADKYGHVESSR